MLLDRRNGIRYAIANASETLLTLLAGSPPLGSPSCLIHAEPFRVILHARTHTTHICILFASGALLMLTGMDDGVRFMNGHSIQNSTTGVSTLDSHSIDLNAYLYKEKRTMSDMAAVLGNKTGAG